MRGRRRVAGQLRRVLCTNTRTTARLDDRHRTRDRYRGRRGLAMWLILGWIVVIGLPSVVIITTICWPERVPRQPSIDAAPKGSNDAFRPTDAARSWRRAVASFTTKPELSDMSIHATDAGASEPNGIDVNLPNPFRGEGAAARSGDSGLSSLQGCWGLDGFEFDRQSARSCARREPGTSAALGTLRARLSHVRRPPVVSSAGGRPHGSA